MTFQKQSPIGELRLLEELCQSFMDLKLKSDDAEQQQHERQPDMRHVLFEGLFGCNSKQLTEMDHFRLEVLSKLVSLAVSIKGVSILECAAIWIYNQVCVHQIVLTN